MSHVSESSFAAPSSQEPDFAELEGAARDYAQATGARRAALRDDLIVRAVPVARRLARRYRDRGEPLEDLEQVALIGLIKAVDGYDPTRGPFGGYLFATACGELRRHFRDRGWQVRVPRKLQELALQVTQTSARMTADRSRPPSAVELAEELTVTPPEVLEALAASSAYRPASLNATPPGGSGELGDALGGPDGEMSRMEDRLTIAELLCRLPARERQMLALRFYGNHTQAEIAQALGMSQMHTSRLLSQALAWLREALLSDCPAQWKPGRTAADATRLGVRTTAQAGQVVVELSGELDRDCSDELRRTLSSAVRRARGGQLRVDLSGVSFVDAAVIAVIIGIVEATRRAGVPLRLSGARRYVGHALATAGLWPHLRAAGTAQ